jgi:hypothetical protein
VSSDTIPAAPASVSTKAVPDEATKEGDSLDRELLDFNLSKSYEAWQEAQKTASKAFVSYVAFLSLTGVLLWGEGIENKVSVPVLSLTIDRRSASVWTLILSGVTLYWFSVSRFYLNLVARRVGELLHKRYGVSDTVWQMEHPSPFLTVLRLVPGLAYSKKWALMAPALLFVLVLLTFYAASFIALPTLFVWKTGGVFGFGSAAKFAMSFGAALAVAPAAFLTFTRRTPEIDKRLLKAMGARSNKELNFEIDAEAKKKCFELYGLDCQVCGLSFKEVHGQSGQKFMQVHLIKPWSEIGELEVLNPAMHLRPVCPNCHAILHLENPSLSIDAVKNMLGGRPLGANNGRTKSY